MCWVAWNGDLMVELGSTSFERELSACGDTDRKCCFALATHSQWFMCTVALGTLPTEEVSWLCRWHESELMVGVLATGTRWTAQMEQCTPLLRVSCTSKSFMAWIIAEQDGPRTLVWVPPVPSLLLGFKCGILGRYSAGADHPAWNEKRLSPPDKEELHSTVDDLTMETTRIRHEQGCQARVEMPNQSQSVKAW